MYSFVQSRNCIHAIVRMRMDTRFTCARLHVVANLRIMHYLNPLTLPYHGYVRYLTLSNYLTSCIMRKLAVAQARTIAIAMVAHRSPAALSPCAQYEYARVIK